MLTISNIPLSVYNRALELYGQPPEADVVAASIALVSAENRIDYVPDHPGMSALAQAVAEHISSGDGYKVTVGEVRL